MFLFCGCYDWNRTLSSRMICMQSLTHTACLSTTFVFLWVFLNTVWLPLISCWLYVVIYFSSFVAMLLLLLLIFLFTSFLFIHCSIRRLLRCISNAVLVGTVSISFSCVFFCKNNNFDVHCTVYIMRKTTVYECDKESAQNKEGVSLHKSLIHGNLFLSLGVCTWKSNGGSERASPKRKQKLQQQCERSSRIFAFILV